MKKTLSIIIPAFNEEAHVRDAIDSVARAVEDVVSEYEIIVVDDGSSDRTGVIIDEIAQAQPHVRVLHNEVNRGYGFSFAKGIKQARLEYVGVFPGDNDMSGESFRQIVQAIGEEDIIIAYNDSSENRSWLRFTLSRTYVWIINTLFQLRLKYYNGANIYLTDAVKQLQINAQGLTISTEILIKLLKAKATFKEVPFTHTGREGTRSSALRFKSVWQVLSTIVALLKEIYFAPKKHTIVLKHAGTISKES